MSTERRFDRPLHSRTPGWTTTAKEKAFHSEYFVKGHPELNSGSLFGISLLYILYSKPWWTFWKVHKPS